MASIIRRKGGMARGKRCLAWLLLAAMVVILLVAAWTILGRTSLSGTTDRRDFTWRILQTEKMSFLTTQRQEWQANIGTARAAWYGIEETKGSILADLYYGFDMSELTQEDIEVEDDGTVVIHLPNPRLLTVSIRPETYDAVTKQSILMKLKTMVLDDADEETRRRFASLKREVLMDMLQNQRYNFDELQDGVKQFLDPIFERQGIPYRLDFPEQAPSRAILNYLKDSV